MCAHAAHACPVPATAPARVPRDPQCAPYRQAVHACALTNSGAALCLFLQPWRRELRHAGAVATARFASRLRRAAVPPGAPGTVGLLASRCAWLALAWEARSVPLATACGGRLRRTRTRCQRRIGGRRARALRTVAYGRRTTCGCSSRSARLRSKCRSSTRSCTGYPTHPGPCCALSNAHTRCSPTPPAVATPWCGPRQRFATVGDRHFCQQ
jgi:hypothetical protein